MADVVITEFMDEASIAELLSPHFEVLYDPSLVDEPAALQAAIGSARAVIVRNRTEVSAELLEFGPDLRAVGRLGVGLDNIDLDACGRRDVAVFPATGANDVSVAEYVLLMAMTLLRNLAAATTQVSAGRWPRQAFVGGELAGRKLGLVGMGAIARATAQRAESFGMRILGCDPFVDAQDAIWGRYERCSLDVLLAESDVVSLHVPLNASTHHLIDAAALARMRPTAVVINAARGGVVDEDALIKSLRVNAIAGAALDVFESEPVDVTTGAKFASLDNLILTPHVAGVTMESNVRVSRVVAEKIRSHLQAGRPS